MPLLGETQLVRLTALRISQQSQLPVTQGQPAIQRLRFRKLPLL